MAASVEDITLTDDQTSVLIDLCEQYPCLWDPGCRDYKDRTAKQRAKEAIAAAMGNGWTEGTITTSESLTSMFLYMLHYPEVARKIQTEVDRVVGPEQNPTLEHRSKCHYTEATVLETQRLLCLLPQGIPHRTINDTEFQGYFIPQGTLVQTNTWKFHRSGECWDEALEFRPDRFLDDDGELVPASHPLRQQLLPFGVGKRTCPGESFARARMFLYLSTLLHQYDILPPENGQLLPVTPESWIMGSLMILKSYKCQFRRREKCTK